MKKFFSLFILTLTMYLLSASFVSADADLAKILKPAASVPEGYYILMPQCAPSRALSIKNASTSRYATAVSKTYAKDSSQIFYIDRLSDGTYTLKNKKSKLVLGVKNSSTEDGAIVRQSSYTGGNFQKWYFFKVGSYYMIQSAISNKMLTVLGRSTLNNARVYMHYYHEHMKGEHWALVKVGGAVSSGSDAQEEDEITSKYGTTKKTGMSASDYEVLNNIIGAVETGGQVYGQRDYGDYTAPFTNSSLEYTCTLGWGAFYGEEAQYLISQILKKAPTTFKKIDKKGLIQKALEKNWVTSRWNPSSAEKAVLKKLIVTKIGKAVQDQMMTQLMKTYVNSCISEYTKNTWAIMMYCEVRHLGGKSGADRIFGRCKAKNSYTLDTIMWALKQDQKDTSSSNQIGDSKFWSRHEKCCEFIEKYA